MAVRSNLQSTTCPELDTDCEVLWTKIVTKDKKNLHVCAYYRNKTSDAVSLDLFETSLRRASSTGSRIIAAGDLNFPDWDWEKMTLKEGAKFPALHTRLIDLLHDLGMEQVVRQPTRFGPDNVLDLVITNTPQLIPRVEIMPGISDHETVYFEYKSKVVPKNNRTEPFPIYGKANWDEMREDLRLLLTEVRSMARNGASAQELCTKYENGYKDMVKKNIPHKKKGGNKTDELPWMTYEIKKKIRARDRVYKKKVKTKDEQLDAKVKKMNQEIQKKLRRSHWDYVNGLFAQRKDEVHNTQRMKRFWTYIKHQRTSQAGVSPLKENGRLATDSKEKAEILSRQFISAYSEGRKYSPEEAKEKCKMQDSNDKKSDFTSNHPTMPDFIITTAGVEKLLRNLDPAKAPGPDGISPRVLKEMAKETAPILTIIYRRSLETGVVPDAWKTAHVTPIYKKGEHYNPANYRPVSLTSVPCKIMEHILVSQIMTHLEKNNILCSQQHGFRKGHSCETQLLELTNDITRNLDNGIQTDIVVLDFAKAFDKVNHSLLVMKLDHYGIRGLVNNWISSFLTDRQQAVVVDGSRSEFAGVKSGVPQGSVLGPCLFLTYINDLPEKIKSMTRLFADDTALDKPIQAIEDTQILQEDLVSLEEWEKIWDMEFHALKCNVMTCSRSQDIIKADYKLHGQTLERVTSAGYLGLNIQQDGQWSEHIDSLSQKGNRLLGFLRRNLKIGSKYVKEQAYKMLVRPSLEYACTVWDPHSETECYKIEKIQRRAARWVLSRHRNTSSVGDMLDILNWPTLEDRRKGARLKMLYKTLDKSVAMNFGDDLQYNPQRPRRTVSKLPNERQLVRHFSRCDYRTMAFLPRTIRDWNSLDQELVAAPSLDAFSSRLARLY